MFLDKPEVKIIADSICDTRITTFQVKYWRPLLPEMNTHRIFSRNAASSRAQSFDKRCDAILSNPAVPAHWNAEKPGMVGGEEFSDEIKDYICQRIQALADSTIKTLKDIDEQVNTKTGSHIHKQYLNRYLEPFCTTTQLITSTDWDNFFRLRMASDAQPEIKDVATEMFYALLDSTPRRTDLHLPYVTPGEFYNYGPDIAKKISVARCARVSYKPYGGSVLLEKDLELYDRLLKSGHMSPFEHAAVPAKGHYFNLNGWRSLRYDLEHRIDSGSEGGDD